MTHRYRWEVSFFPFLFFTLRYAYLINQMGGNKSLQHAQGFRHFWPDWVAEYLIAHPFLNWNLRWREFQEKCENGVPDKVEMRKSYKEGQSHKGKYWWKVKSDTITYERSQFLRRQVEKVEDSKGENTTIWVISYIKGGDTMVDIQRKRQNVHNCIWYKEKSATMDHLTFKEDSVSIWKLSKGYT